MKRKHFKQISILLLMAILVIGMGIVLSGSTRRVYAVGSKKMKLNHSSVTMQAGTKRILKITKNKPSGTVKRISSNKKAKISSFRPVELLHQGNKGISPESQYHACPCAE